MIYESVTLPFFERCSILPIGGRLYVSYRKGPSKRVNGKLKHDRVNIGRYQKGEHGEDLFHPNDKYYQIFDKKPPVLAVASRRGRRAVNRQAQQSELPEGHALAFGFGVAVHHVITETNLEEILSQCLEGDEVKACLVVASFMARGHGSFTGIEHFCRHQMAFGGVIMQPANCSLLLNKLTSTMQKAFFKKWIKKFGKERKICYDVTSISTYSSQIRQAAYGYNRDKEKLKQINVGYFADYESKLPLYYTYYNGNINDFTNFPNALKLAKEVGIDSTYKLVMDGIFSEKKTVDFSHIQGVNCLIGAPIDNCPGVRNELKAWRNGINPVRDDILNSRIDDMSMKSVPFVIGSTTGRLLMYYFDNDHKQEEANLRDSIKIMKAELDSKKTISSKQALNYKPYFSIQLENNKLRSSPFSYTANIEAIEEELRLCGCMALFSTDEHEEQEKELICYREKDIVEKMFGMLKNDICHERTYMKKDSALAAKLFLCFLALIIRKILQNKLSSWIERSRLSLDAAFEILEDIEVEKSNDVWILKKALTKQQKEIIKELELPIFQIAQNLPLKVDMVSA